MPIPVDGEVAFYIRVLGPVMPFLYLESMVDGVLKGLNQQLSTFRYSVYDSVGRIAKKRNSRYTPLTSAPPSSRSVRGAEIPRGTAQGR